MEIIATLPQYQSHKVVRAAKIKRIEHLPLTEDLMAEPGFPYARLHFEDLSIPSVMVDIEYMKKHKPEAGGYFTQYENGYPSWSPAGVFESGHTRLQ